MRGDPPAPEFETIAVDASQISVGAMYRLMISAIVPRPIAVISTCDKTGNGNLAPFSYFNAVASAPPTLMVSFTTKRDGGRKDTLKNILETEEFVVNLAARWFLDRMHQASAEYPEGFDERELVGLKALPSIRVKPVRVQESPVQLECKLSQTVQIGVEGAPGSSTVVFGEIVMAHVRADAYKNGRLDIRLLEPIARLGGQDYGALGEVLTREAAEVPT